MNEVKKRRLFAVLALGAAAAILAYISFGGIGENLVYFWNPKQLLEQGDNAFGATVRLGGVVQNGTVVWEPENVDLKFSVGIQPDENADSISVAVHAKGAPPQMFREGIGVVVEGSYNGTVFAAHRVLVKHSNEYRPPEAGNEPQKIYETLLTD